MGSEGGWGVREGREEGETEEAKRQQEGVCVQ